MATINEIIITAVVCFGSGFVWGLAYCDYKDYKKSIEDI